MATIKAPFNFVPVSEKVFFPEWAKEISHDIPFEDGESGVIELKITTKSPIFVRNGHTKSDADNKNDEFKSFSKVDDKYFIPATSIKGAIRNVLEIMSFGKMRLDENAMFAQREWDNPNLYPLKAQQPNFFCGYLRRNGNDYEIVDCGKPYRIGQKRIDERIGNNIFENNFSQNKGIDINKEIHIGDRKYDPKTAAYKYKLLEKYPELFELHHFEEDGEFTNEYKQNRLTFSNTGQHRGQLVLTGQPDKWTWPRPTRLDARAGKYYEFVFLEPDSNSKSIPLSEIEFNHFKFIYLKSPEWERAKELIEKEGIPVFFRKDGDKIKDLGLAFLYKLPYENSPFETLKPYHKNDGKRNRKQEADMADCLFGFTGKPDSLKGRIQVSHAFSDAKVVHIGERIVTLGSPKASYYPLYVQQNGRTVIEYATYNAQGQISGWKRYMIRENVWGTKDNDEYNANLDSILLPLDEGITFNFKIRYHNLKKVELGALLSALTFHNTDGCFYQLGQGKPYGFGKVKFDILHIDSERMKDYLYEFEKIMEKHNPKWIKSDQVKELITMASKSVSDRNSDRFKYLKMDNNRNRNEFQKVKTDKEALLTYSAIIGDSVTPLSLYDERIEKEYNTLIDDAMTLKNEEKYDLAKAKLEEAGKLYPNGSKHDNLLTEVNKICAEKEQAEKEKKEKEKQAESDKAKIKAGLSFLEEKYPDGVKYKVINFKGAKNRIDQWMKKSGVESLPQEQWEMLRQTLSRLYQQQDKKEQKLWKDFNSHIWQTIARYIGEEKAKEFFEYVLK
jgi:CRISPR-associated protein (TIGR03986 family)